VNAAALDLQCQFQSLVKELDTAGQESHRRSALVPNVSMWSNVRSSQLSPTNPNAGWDIALPKPKRRKIEIACETCRLRKSRCDGEKPSMIHDMLELNVD
jgi:hypothetical protein